MEETGNEKLARFLTSRNHYSPKNKAVKARAFLPPNDKLSVFCVGDMPYSKIVTLGSNINLSDTRRLHGHAIIVERHVSDTGLAVHRDDSPFRHANILGWPPEKDKRMDIAQELAAAADLFLHRIQ
ncbi:MAG: hypothetical protein KAY24_07915 [Candidatus Eisenbacteria sp.]|nr:hypothetical protein [Candidatus Eisenbacteria bacterium]